MHRVCVCCDQSNAATVANRLALSAWNVNGARNFKLVRPLESGKLRLVVGYALRWCSGLACRMICFLLIELKVKLIMRARTQMQRTRQVHQ
jgi:hypothetical protein